MGSKLLYACLLAVVLIVVNVSPSEGTWCPKQAVRYSSQKYCTKHSWWNWFCLSYGYRRISQSYMKRECCPGYKGTDCATPICHTRCGTGFICSSPDKCSPDPNYKPPTTTTKKPTPRPTTKAPTPRPTTKAPTERPTTRAPTEKPATKAPTEGPTTMAPTEKPKPNNPTAKPTPDHTAKPTPNSKTQKPNESNSNKGGKGNN
ncbi:salivary glue protein Sgs-3 isoform X2 [Magallana gigas]|uniref:salivary glue protein Sgs-3 isoform X2 n=1 Tax=Magallana gigas TaxID=29159 RepID=UPI003342BDB5